MSLAVQGNDLWVGTMTGGVNIIRNDHVVATFINDPNDSDSLSDNRVSRILTDSGARPAILKRRPAMKTLVWTWK